jgi:hypothetical protein
MTDTGIPQLPEVQAVKGALQPDALSGDTDTGKPPAPFDVVKPLQELGATSTAAPTTPHASDSEPPGLIAPENKTLPATSGPDDSVNRQISPSANTGTSAPEPEVIGAPATLKTSDAGNEVHQSQGDETVPAGVATDPMENSKQPSKSAAVPENETPPVRSNAGSAEKIHNPQSNESNVSVKKDKPTSTPDTASAEETAPKQKGREPLPAERTLSESELWAQRVEAISKKIRLLEKSPKDADDMYHELSTALRTKRELLRQALRSALSPQQKLQYGTVAELHAAMTSLYKSRSQLLKVVTPELRASVTGTGVVGMNKLRGELEYLLLHWQFHALAIPQLGPQIVEQLQQAPLPVIWGALKFILAILLFRWWRAWAAQGLVRLRTGVLDIRPRTRRNLRVARFIWYVERVRYPVEWLILMLVVFDIIDVPSLGVIEQLCRIILYWILLSRIAIALIHAVATRGVAGLSRENSTLELRSLRLVAAWLVILGMGVDIADTYARAGTIYTWVWMLFEILFIPVLLLLIIWWRKEVFQRLRNLPQQPPLWVEKVLARTKGFRSYMNAAIGAVYLILLSLRKFILRQLSDFDTGRQLLASLLGREVAREYERQKSIDGNTDISDKLREALLADEGKLIEKVASKELKRLIEIVEFGHGGAIALISERGAGKSVLLNRLAAKFDGNAVLLDCPVTGYEELRQAFVDALGVPKEKSTVQEIIRSLRETGTRFISLDNAHRLIRPKMGGMAEFEKLADLIRAIAAEVPIPWVATINKAGWQYLRRVRAEQVMLEDLIELPPWTQEQLGELVEARSEAVGIHPDFSQIIIPHQFDEVVYETLEERNRAGFFRILWNASGGNPKVALQLWADALVQTEHGEIAVLLPQQMASAQLENANLQLLLVLRVIMQTEVVSAEDIISSLRLAPPVVMNALHVSELRGWIEESAGLYRLAWRWYQTVARVLSRQNLLAR